MPADSAAGDSGSTLATGRKGDKPVEKFQRVIGDVCAVRHIAFPSETGLIYGDA